VRSTGVWPLTYIVDLRTLLSMTLGVKRLGNRVAAQAFEFLRIQASENDSVTFGHRPATQMPGHPSFCKCQDTQVSEQITYAISSGFPIAFPASSRHTGGMTYARSQIAPPGEYGCFHVVTRCVRRAFLCGSDRVTGKTFDHRRKWIEDRIRFLAESFAVSVYSYAVMSNHCHLVIAVEPQAVLGWTDEEVVDRWLLIFPGALANAKSDEQKELVRTSLLSTPDRLAEIRERLGSLSWFMRALNEPIARMANQEDGCTGRFWEGRFKCQALLEPQALVSAMAYVDLNPARANLAQTLEKSDHTSIKLRIEDRKSESDQSALRTRPLKPVAGLDAEALLGMTEASYIELVQWTGLQPHPNKRGRLVRAEASPENPPSAIWNLTNHPDRWLRQVQGTESRYFRAIGSAEALMAKAKTLGQRWMKGVCAERASLILRSQTE